jgi:hypothetical protein
LWAGVHLAPAPLVAGVEAVIVGLVTHGKTLSIESMRVGGGRGMAIVVERLA